MHVGRKEERKGESEEREERRKEGRETSLINKIKREEEEIGDAIDI